MTLKGSHSRSLFGQRQIEQLLEDRPDMINILPMSHPVVQWLIEGFNGERVGQRVYWSNYSPVTGRASEICLPSELILPFIAISGGGETTPIDKWASLVFEMHNMEMIDEIDRVTEFAIDGIFDMEEFIEELIKLEFLAAIETRRLFLKHPLPKSRHGRDEWYNWLMNRFPTYEDFRESLENPTISICFSNYKYFKDYYESTIVPHLSEK